MVEQPIIHATVIASSVFGPHSWGELLREDLSSLKGPDHLLNH